MGAIGIATNRKIIDLYNMLKDGTLVLKPSFQRKLVWNDNHKEKFIQTIIDGLPFPEVYFTEGEIDLETQKSKTLVVDGQQRLSTIYQYITNSKEFTIKNIVKFGDLPDEKKVSFFDYVVVVRDLGRLDDEKVRDIFKRINSVQYALNAIEVNNALYDGSFITTAKVIVENNRFFSDLDIFSEVETSRMKDLEFILLVMATIEEGGYFTRDSKIEEYIRKFDLLYNNQGELVNYFKEVVCLIVQCNLNLDSIWFRKSNFFTLLVELIKFRKGYGVLPIASSLAPMLNEFEKNLNENKYMDINNNKFALYYYYVFQGSTGRKGRYTRGKLLKEYLDNLT